VKPAPFRYHDPSSVDETLRLLAELEDAKVLAGGQSLMPLMNMRLTGFADLIDLGRVPDLAGIATDDGHLRIGAMSRQRDCERDPGLAQVAPLLVEALTHVGHFQTRNRGTIGGSLAHLDPTAEMLAVASAMDATLHVASAEGNRSVSIHDFAQLPFMPDLEPDELLTSIELPVWSAEHGHAFVEFAPRHGDFAVAAVAALAELDGEGRFSRASVSLTGMSELAIRARDIEELVIGEAPGDVLFAGAAELARRHPATPDIHGPSEYRQHLIGVLTERALRRACERAGRRA
jgi:aerobic carbon-monoxide dehydrogenase medium subunit